MVEVKVRKNYIGYIIQSKTGLANGTLQRSIAVRLVVTEKFYILFVTHQAAIN